MGFRDAQHAAASWVLDFAAGGYGPHGAGKLVASDGGEPVWLRSAADALREADPPEALVRPYVELAARTQSHAGDHATAAILVAARLVRSALDDATGAGVPAFLDGYALAARQSRAVLQSLAEPRSDTEALGAVVPGAEWADPLVAGLRTRLRRDGAIDLSAIELRAEGDGAGWLDGAVVEPQWTPREPLPGTVGVVLATAPWKVAPRAEGATLRVGRAGIAAWHRAEEGRRAAVLASLRALGAGLVVCASSIDESLCGALAAHGAAVWTDAPLSAIARLERATGAARVARLEDAAPGDTGRARLHRRGRRQPGWLAVGAGPAAAFSLPDAPAPFRAARIAEGERLLRAAGLHFTDPRAVAGGGRWQRQVAASLRRAADAAPGRAPIAVRAAGNAFDALADLLVANAGRDPAEARLLPDAEGVWDSHPGVRLAVSASFEAAIAVLRLDGAHRRAASSAAALRGPGRPTRIVGGDVPPLM